MTSSSSIPSISGCPSSSSMKPLKEEEDNAAPIIVDDKSQQCLTFIELRHQLHLCEHGNEKPFFIGLNGIQGVGKTTLVSTLAAILREKGYETLVFSIDDLYLKHDDLVGLAKLHPFNPLVQHRGEPGTHDMELARQIFPALKAGKQTEIPEFNKAAFDGAGDRVPMQSWPQVNGQDQKKIQVIIFEGWCVGFKSLTEEQVKEKWEGESTTLHTHQLEHLLFINWKLKAYDVMTDCFDAFIFIDAEKTDYVFEWRLQQEVALRKSTGSGMSDEKVFDFVLGYYPGYELYLDNLRGKGLFKDAGRMLRLVVGKDRRVIRVLTT